jgi:hypothetical protein
MSITTPGATDVAARAFTRVINVSSHSHATIARRSR